MVKKLWSKQEDGQLPNWLSEEEKSRCYCDDRGWVLVHKDGNEEVIVASNTLNLESEKGHGFDAEGKSLDPQRNSAHNDISYSLSKSSEIINEGAFVTVTLTTNGVDDNTQVPYTIEGIEPEDLQSGELSGNFLVSGGTASINLTASNDLLTEGQQTMVVRLGTGESISIDINDTSKEPSYSLSAPASINEGENLTISLTTENVDNGPIGYQISGIQAEDLSSGTLTGDFQLSGGSADLNLTIASDLSFNEGSETLVLDLNNGEASVSVVVNDTSVATPVYTLSAPASIDEGQTLTITLNTQYVNNGPVGYQISGITAADLDAGSDPLTGNFTVSGSPSTDSITLNLKSDLSFNEGDETLTLNLDGGLGSVSVTVNDSSTATPTYSLNSNPTNSVNEGQSLTITLNTQYVNDGPVGYQISGITAADLDAGSDPLTGSFNIESNTDSITLNLLEDISFEEGNETLVLALDNGQASINITVNDSSTATPSYSLSAPASVNEGQSVTISLSTQYVSAGTVINYTLGGSVDLANDFDSALSNTGQFVVGSNESVTLNLKSDLSFNEGNENLTLTLQDGLGSASVEIVDSSTATPSYSLSAPASINEGQSLTITLDTQNVNDGPVGYSIEGITAADLDAGSDPLTGSFTVSGSPSTDSITLNLSEDVSFEEGNETLTLTLDGDLDSVSVTVNDSSTATPSYSLSTLGNVTFVNEGDSLTISLSTQYVSNGTAIPYTIGGSVDLANDFDTAISNTGQFVVGSSESVTFNLKEDLSFEEGDETLTLSLDGLNTQISVIVKDTSKATEVYTLSAPASVNEGETLSIALNTQYVSAGTVVNYTLGGSVELLEDFDAAINSSGSFVVGTTETLNLNLDSDLSFNEGDETLTLTLQDSLGSVSVNIIDTSVAIPTYTLTAPGSINEGQDLVITLTTQYVNDGPVGYQISGITAADLDAGSDPLIGDFDIVNNTDSITLKIKSDLSFNEGNETLTLTLDNGEDAINVTVNDSSTATPVYTLSAPASVNEGQSLTITLDTQYVNDGSVGYQISGITAADLDAGSDPLTGNFILSGGTDSITLNISEDLSSNENNENLVLSLNNGEASISVTVVDTSKAPVYTLTSSPEINVNEGASLSISLQTENVSGNTVAYSVSGITAADLDAGSAPLSGNFTLDIDGAGSIQFNIKADSLTEEPDEVLLLELTGVGESISVNINDTSKSPIWNLSTSPVGSVNEGVDLVITLQTQNVPDGNYGYQITSSTGFGADDLDVGSDALTGDFIVSGSPSSVTKTLKIKKDYTSGEGEETLTISLNNGEVSPINIIVNDSSSIDPSEEGTVSDSDVYIYPEISKDGQYLVMASEYTQGAAIYKLNNTNSSWDYLQTVDDAPSHYLGVGRAFSQDGSILALSDAYNTGNNIFVYERGVDGLYTLRDNFTTTNGGTHEWGVALSSDGNTLVATNRLNIETFEYSNSAWSSVDSFSLDYTPYNADISSDNQTMVVANGNGSSTSLGGVVVYTRNGNSWTEQTRFKSSETHDSVRGVSISNNDQLIAYGNFGVFSGTSKIFFFDWDGSQWVERSGNLSESGVNGHTGMGYYIGMAEPDSNNNVKLITTSGKIYNVPATLSTYTITGPSSIDEGQDLVLTLSTLGINGNIAYTISGITDADLDIAGGSASTTGNFNVSNETGSITLKLLEDANSIDGSLTITVDQGGPDEASKTVTINDITPLPELSELNIIEDYGGHGSISPDGTTITAHAWADAAGADANVRIFSRNPADSSISANPTYVITPPTGVTSYWGSEHISMNNDGTILAISDTSGNKTYIHEYDSSSDSYVLEHTITNAGTQNQFGKASISSDGTMMVIVGRRDKKVWTYQYNGSSWNIISSATVTISSGRLESTSISNNKTVLVVADQYENIYTYDWVPSTSSWSLRSGATLSLGSGTDSYGDSLSLTKDGDVLVIGSSGGNGTWKVYDWDGSQWNFRFTGDDDPNETAVGAYVSSSDVANGYFTVAVTYKRNTDTQFRIFSVIETPQNP